jgi:hypothetical protein
VVGGTSHRRRERWSIDVHNPQQALGTSSLEHGTSAWARSIPFVFIVAFLSHTEDHGALFLSGGAHKGAGGPVALEGVLGEARDAAEGNGAGAARGVLDVFEIEEVIPEFFLGDTGGGLVIMVRQLTDGSDRRLLGPCGQAAELYILDYALWQWGHGYTSCTCCTCGLIEWDVQEV